MEENKAKKPYNKRRHYHNHNNRKGNKPREDKGPEAEAIAEAAKEPTVRKPEKPEKVEKAVKDYEVSNNPILLFLQDTELSQIENQPTKDVHKAYRVFCLENGFTEMTLANFSKELNRRLGVTVARRRINGKLVGIYVKER